MLRFPVLALTLVLSSCMPGSEDLATYACPVSAFVDHAPEGAESLPATWLGNRDATLWVANLSIYSGKWYAGPEGMKIHWWRSEGSFSEDPLMVEGSLLDGTSAQLSAHIPCCYGSDQVTVLEFPAGGCWEIVAHTGDADMKFVVQVEAD